MTRSRDLPLWLARAGAVAACVAALAAAAMATAGASTTRADPAAATLWSAPRTIAPITEYASAPQLAVNESGRAVAAWLGGTPPRVTAGGARAQRAAVGGGLTIVAVLGSARDGFGKPVLVGGGNGTEAEGDPQAAISGSGEAYVAWGTPHGFDVATAAGRRFGAPRPLQLPAGSQLLELTAGRSGPADVVWYRYHVHSAPALYYAPLTAAGGVGRIVTVAHLGSPVSNIELAVNDWGALAASWVNGEQGLDPRHPRAFPRVRAILCSPRGRCAAAQTLSLGPPAHQFENTATTISDDGTATVLAAGENEALVGGLPWEIGPDGLWGAVSRRGQRFRPTPEISPIGDHPVAVASGRSGVAALFTIDLPFDTFAYTGLPGTGSRFTAPAVVSDPNTVDTPVLASDLTGRTVVAWLDNTGGASSSVHAIVGEGLSAPVTVAAASRHIGGPVTTGIDGHGNAIVLWAGVGANGLSHGIFAAFHRA